jgi:hypothetical protein
MKPCEPIESVIVTKTRKCPTWLEATLQEVERIKAPSGTFRERKNPKILSIYAKCMKQIINEEPTTFKEESQKKQWKEVMTKEY